MFLMICSVWLLFDDDDSWLSIMKSMIDDDSWMMIMRMKTTNGCECWWLTPIKMVYGDDCDDNLLQ